MRFIYFFILVSFCFAKGKQEILQYVPTFEKHIQKTMDDYLAPGLAVAIVKDGEIIYTKTMGTKENNKDLPIDDETVFQIASVSKTFLVFVIAQLVDEKVLSWDTPVRKYVPELEFSDKSMDDKITLIDLITHRIGLPVFSGDSMWHLGFSIVELIKSLKYIPLKFVPREHYGYQNHMFSVASLLVERVTKKSIETLYEERIFKPLGLKTASVGMDSLKPKFFGLKKPNFALPHDIRDGVVYTKPLMPHMYMYPGGTGINISIKEMAKWLKFLVDDYAYNGKKFLNPETVKYIRSSKIKIDFSDYDLQFSKDRFSNSSYDVGLFESQYGPNPEHRLFGHMGGFNGVRSYMCFMPSEKLGIVILSNLGSMRVSLMPEVIRNTFLDWYLDLPKINWIERIHGTEVKYRSERKNTRTLSRIQYLLSARDFKEYVGLYHHDIYGDLRITQQEKDLIITYRGKAIQLTYWNGDEFDMKPHDLSPSYGDYDVAPVQFVRTQDGSFKLYVGNMSEGQNPFFMKVRS